MNWMIFFLSVIMTFVAGGAIPTNPDFTKKAVNDYALKAKNGDPDSQYLYAWALHKGLGCKKDLMLAYEYASKAAAQNIGEAFYLLAIGNDQAWNAHRDCDAADSYANKYYQWAKSEVENTDGIRAHCALASCYECGYGVKEDIVAMTNHYTIAANAGSNLSAEKLCDIHSFNKSLRNYEAVLKWAHIAAERGSSKACSILGDVYGKRTLYGRGDDSPRDYKKSVEWLKKSATNGEDYFSAADMFTLGHCYEEAIGVPRDPKEAYSWYKKSAEAGFEPGYGGVAMCYFNGTGVKEDASEGVRWCLQAIQIGEYKAAELLAHCYSMGIGVHKDIQESKRWARMARGSSGVDLDMFFKISFGADIAPMMQQLNITSSDKTKLVCYDLGGINTPDPNHISLPGSENFCSFRPETIQYDTLNKELVAIVALMPKITFSDEQIPMVYERISKQIKGIVEHDIKPKYTFTGSQHNWIWNLIDKRGRDSEIRIRAFKNKIKSWSFMMMISSYVPDEKKATFNSSVATGTGWWVNKTDLITCWHVVKDGKLLSVEAKNGTRTSAKIVARDVRNDIAVLRISEESLAVSPIRLNTKRAKVSDRVFTFGYPLPSLLGQTQKYTEGVVCSLTGIADDARYYQISVPIQPGNSGGALVDQNGEVIGMTTSALDALITATMTGTLPQNVNYAVKARYIAALLDDSDIPYNENCAEKTNTAVESASASTVLVIAEF